MKFIVLALTIAVSGEVHKCASVEVGKRGRRRTSLLDFIAYVLTNFPANKIIRHLPLQLP